MKAFVVGCLTGFVAGALAISTAKAPTIDDTPVRSHSVRRRAVCMAGRP